MLFELFVATMAVNLKTCFEPFCHDFGLEHQFSSPYVACQNGVVERKNRSLCEMARTMLDEHRTPRRYWAEVVNTAFHVGNRIF
jgi:transposase InsO family protein